MEKNKKTWLGILVVLAIGAAATVGLTMGGKLFRGDIGAEPSTCEEGGKGCETYITKAEWLELLVNAAPNVDKNTLENCTTSPFIDTQGHKLEKYICYAAKVGWAKGFESGTYEPENYLTRAQGAEMISQIFGLMWKNPKAQAPDIQTTEWYYDYANTLIRYKFPTTKQNQNFYPTNLLTKTDAESWVNYAKKVAKPTTAPTPATPPTPPANPPGPAKPTTTPKAASVINRASLVRSVIQGLPGYSQSEVEKCKDNIFSDLKAGSAEAQFACYAKKLGITSGFADGTFKPTKKVSRAEGLKMIEVAFEIGIGGPTLGCSDVNYDKDWFASYFEIAESNQFPNLKDTSGKCNPATDLTTTDAKEWIKYAKNL